MGLPKREKSFWGRNVRTYLRIQGSLSFPPQPPPPLCQGQWWCGLNWCAALGSSSVSHYVRIFSPKSCAPPSVLFHDNTNGKRERVIHAVNLVLLVETGLASYIGKSVYKALGSLGRKPLDLKRRWSRHTHSSPDHPQHFKIGRGVHVKAFWWVVGDIPGKKQKQNIFKPEKKKRKCSPISIIYCLFDCSVRSHVRIICINLYDVGMGLSR